MVGRRRRALRRVSAVRRRSMAAIRQYVKYILDIPLLSHAFLRRSRYIPRMTLRRSSPRGPVAAPRLRVLEALRGGLRTVSDLAARLGVTDNAVRGHLALLARDGLVRTAGLVRSRTAGKPAVEYEMTTEAEVTLSRAYAPALIALVEVLSARLAPRTLRAALRAAGHRLAPPAAESPSLAAATESARDLLTALGASVHIESARGHTYLRGDSCPLAAAVTKVPATCTLVEGMLEKHTRRRVEQRCEHGAHPRCAFRLR